VVLEGGRVRDVGTHRDLVRTDGPYRDAWLLQSEEIGGER
jgi:ABC-type transport system involved in Fe-S cluster assembly fused permease/ATPase subunit